MTPTGGPRKRFGDAFGHRPPQCDTAAPDQGGVFGTPRRIRPCRKRTEQVALPDDARPLVFRLGSAGIYQHRRTVHRRAPPWRRKAHRGGRSSSSSKRLMPSGRNPFTVFVVGDGQRVGMVGHQLLKLLVPESRDSAETADPSRAAATSWPEERAIDAEVDQPVGALSRNMRDPARRAGRRLSALVPPPRKPGRFVRRNIGGHVQE